MSKYIKEVLYLLGENRKKVPRLFILFVGASFLELVGISLIGPYVTLVISPDKFGGKLASVVDFFHLPQSPQSILLLFSGMLFVIFLVKSVVAVLINRAIALFVQKQKVVLSSYLMKTYQSLPYVQFLNRNSSEYIYNISTLSAQYTLGVLSPGLRLLSDGLMVLVILGVLAFHNILALSLVVVLFGGVALAHDRICRKRLREYGALANVAATKTVQAIREGMGGFKEIRILGKERHFHEVLSESAKEYAVNTTKLEITTQISRNVLELVLVTFFILYVLISFFTYKNMQALIPTLGMFAVAGMRLFPSINLLIATTAQLRYNRNSVSRLYNDVVGLQQIKQEEFVEVDEYTEAFQSISLKNLSFSYPQTNKCTIDISSLEIFQGESIGIMGVSGAGKTTLIDVLLGLLTPQSGNILYNTKPLSKFLGAWRANVAYLPQQVFLIDNTLRNNVAIGERDEDIDEHRVVDALKKASLHKLVESLPNGIDTVIGEKGVRLSGGERQRAALARAFYYKRSVLILDEATSALDRHTEADIIAEIKKMKGSITLIIIAHSSSTIQHCDRIYRLEAGKVAQVGEPNEVLQAYTATSLTNA